MCGRFNQDEINYIRSQERHWAREIKEQIKYRYNISPGMAACMLTAKSERLATFGFKPSWNPKLLLINARAEGKANEENNPVDWKTGIHTMPAYRKAFAETRCVIPVNGFLEGPEKEKLSKPFLVSRQDGNVFYLGGIYTLFVNEDTGEETPHFAIITTPPNQPTSFIGHYRSPLMISENNLDMWFDAKKIDDLFPMIESGYVEPKMAVTELYPELVKSGREHGEDTMNQKAPPVHFN